MVDILETLMIVSFGISWPINIVKLWKSHSTKGASVYFYCLVFFGYVLGILSKVIDLLEDGIGAPVYVWFFYILNSIMVFVGIIVWFINRRLEIKESQNV